MKRKLEINDVLAGLLGFATADALGVPIEFTTRKSHEESPLTEMEGYGAHPVPEGTWSDDTSMTIAAMDSIGALGGRISFENIMRSYLAWMNDAMYTATDELFDIGMATSQALHKFMKGKIPATECGGRGKYDNGNGSLMRMLPAVYYVYAKEIRGEERLKLIRDYSSLTHAHEISILGCTIYTDYMEKLLEGKSIKDAYDEILRIDYLRDFDSDTVAQYRRILDGNLKSIPADDISSSGYVVHTLEACLWTALNSDSYEQAVITAVNLGDDTDTVGAITGSIAATFFGLDSIPERWLSKLRKKEYLSGIAQKFYIKITAESGKFAPRFAHPD